MSRLPYATAGERAVAREAVGRQLAEGGIIAYPTETVYGLGCALRDDALARLTAFKGPRPFLLLIRSADDARALQWTDAARRLADAFWPGPLTLALDDPRHAFPEQVRSEEGTVAVRVSPHPAIPSLLDAAGGPVTSTSANRPGDPPTSEPGRLAALEDEIPGLLILDAGALPPAAPSTIVRCGPDTRILREGALRRDEIATVTDLV